MVSIIDPFRFFPPSPLRAPVLAGGSGFRGRAGLKDFLFFSLSPPLSLSGQRRQCVIQKMIGANKFGMGSFFLPLASFGCARAVDRHKLSGSSDGSRTLPFFFPFFSFPHSEGGRLHGGCQTDKAAVSERRTFFFPPSPLSFSQILQKRDPIASAQEWLRVNPGVMVAPSLRHWSRGGDFLGSTMMMLPEAFFFFFWQIRIGFARIGISVLEDCQDRLLFFLFPSSLLLERKRTCTCS